jgi:hypothetical protein
MSEKVRPVVISLTTIPSRYQRLPRKVSSILNQSVLADEIEIYVPKTYRRFKSPRETFPKLPPKIRVIQVDEDLGPATKLLYAMKQWGAHDVDILICDDDRLHDFNWLKRFVSARTVRPNEIICERGWNIQERFGYAQHGAMLPRAVLRPNGGRTASYRFLRMLSLGCFHPPRDLYQNPGYVDIFEGFLGAMIRTGSLPELAWQIPDPLWTVDDVWVSGMARLNGVGVWAHGQPRPIRGNGYWDKVDSLTDWSEQGTDRATADRLCVDYFRERFNIWT